MVSTVVTRLITVISLIVVVFEQRFYNSLDPWGRKGVLLLLFFSYPFWRKLLMALRLR